MNVAVGSNTASIGGVIHLGRFEPQRGIALVIEHAETVWMEAAHIKVPRMKEYFGEVSLVG